jgi:hypothetical protein
VVVALMELMRLQQVLPVALKQTAQFAQCAQAMLVSKNVKHANKPFAYWP